MAISWVDAQAISAQIVSLLRLIDAFHAVRRPDTTPGALTETFAKTVCANDPSIDAAAVEAFCKTVEGAMTGLINAKRTTLSNLGITPPPFP